MPRLLREKRLGSRMHSTTRAATLLRETSVRTVRDRLVDVFRFRDHKHDDYGFHITLAYQLQPFSGAEQSEYRAILPRNVPLIAGSAEVLNSPTLNSAPSRTCSASMSNLNIAGLRSDLTNLQIAL